MQTPQLAGLSHLPGKPRELIRPATREEYLEFLERAAKSEPAERAPDVAPCNPALRSDSSQFGALPSARTSIRISGSPLLPSSSVESRLEGRPLPVAPPRLDNDWALTLVGNYLHQVPGPSGDRTLVRLTHSCPKCQANFPEQPIIRRSDRASTIRCPECRAELRISPDLEALRRWRVNAHERSAAVLDECLGETTPQELGVRLAERLRQPGARQLVKNLKLFRPRVLLGGLGPANARSSARRGHPPRRVRVNERCRAAIISYRKHVRGSNCRPVVDRPAALIHPGTSAVWEDGRAMRMEAAGSGPEDWRIVAPPAAEGDSQGSPSWSRRLSICNRSLEKELGTRLGDASWAKPLFRSFGQVRQKALAHYTALAGESGVRSHGADVHSPKARAADRKPPSRRGHLDRLANRARRQRPARRLVRAVRRALASSAHRPLGVLCAKLVVRRFALRLQVRRLRKGLSEARFIEQSAVAAATLGVVPKSRARLGGLVESLIIRRAPPAENELARWRGEVALSTRELLKLVLPYEWHPIVDQFAAGVILLDVPLEDAPGADPLVAPIREALGQGGTQQTVADDFGISQSQVSKLRRRDVPEHTRDSQASIRDRSRIRQVQRRAAIRRSLAVDPAPWTEQGDQIRRERLRDACRRFRWHQPPFPELAPRPLSSQLDLAGKLTVWEPSGPAPSAASASALRTPLPLSGDEQLMALLPLKPEDLIFAADLLIRRPTGLRGADVSGELWPRIQAHHLDGAPRPECPPRKGLAVRHAHATFARFLRGEMLANDPVLGALVLKELGGWIPILIEAFVAAGVSEHLIAPRVGLYPNVVAVYRDLLAPPPPLEITSPDQLPSGHWTVTEALRSLLLSVGRQGLEPLNRFLTSLQYFGGLPKAVRLDSLMLTLDWGDVLAQELAFERIWMTPTTKNLAAIEKLQARLAARTREGSRAPRWPTFDELAHFLSAAPEAPIKTGRVP